MAQNYSNSDEGCLTEIVNGCRGCLTSLVLSPLDYFSQVLFALEAYYAVSTLSSGNFNSDILPVMAATYGVGASINMARRALTDYSQKPGIIKIKANFINATKRYAMVGFIGVALGAVEGISEMYQQVVT